MNGTNARIGIIFSHFRHLRGEGGGLERNRWNLALEYLRRGHPVDVLALSEDGINNIPMHPQLCVYPLSSAGMLQTRFSCIKSTPDYWRELLKPVILPLKGARTLTKVPSIAKYFNTAQPDLVIGGGTQENLAILLARRRARSAAKVLVSQHNPLSNTLHSPKHKKRWRWRYLPPLLRKLYLEADAIVGISKSVANDVERTLSLPHGAVKVIYNPVVDESLWGRLADDISHPWLTDRRAPVVLSVGRMTRQKDHATLIRGFAKARERKTMRLLIIGDGPERQALQDLAISLGVQGDIDMPGFKANPLPYMAHADVFALTSRWEGFGNVLVEAMAADCPIICSDCPGGPREVVDDGRFGTLIPVGNAEAVAESLLNVLNNDRKRKSTKDRASLFSVSRAATAYLEEVGLTTAQEDRPI